ncbi:MAG TPA: hypothetical protein VGN89_10755, partial [Phenylobacterium sp.]|nr:hypothetical protein [Phenylobacterium sp.]
MSYRRLLLTAAATSLALAACNQKPAAPVTGAPIASLPLAEAAPPPEVVAPAADQLPPAPPLRRSARPPRPIYSYVDAAYDLGDAFADSPPDYTVDYEGERPWVWRSGGGEYRVVEQTPRGMREYFYRGGSNYPFLIRDTDYSYAYDNGELVGVYDSYGRPYSNYGPPQIDYASRYLYRARRLYDAALHQQRQAAYAADWREHRDVILAPQRQWAAEQQRNDDWRRWRDQRGSEIQAQQRQVAFDQERAQRQAYSARLAPAIAAAAAPQRQGPPFETRRGFDAEGRQQQVQAQDQARAQADAQRQRAEIARGQFGARDQRGQADAAFRAQEAAQPQGRDQQRLQAEAQTRALNDAGRQQRLQLEAQRGQAELQTRARNDAQRQQPAQARDQQGVQAETQRAQRDAGRQQAEQAQARDQQRAQAEAQRTQRDAGRQQAEQAQSARAAHDQQAQAQAQARDQQRAQAEAQRAQR